MRVRQPIACGGGETRSSNPRATTTWASLVLCGMLASEVAGAPPALTWIEGSASGEPEERSGRLIEVSAEGRLALETRTGTRTLEPGAYARWGEWHEPREGVVFLLADGGMFRGDEWRLRAERIEFLESVTSPWGAAEWRRGSVRGFVLHWPDTPASRDVWIERLLRRGRRFDEVWLADGDRLEGSLRIDAESSDDGAESNAMGERWTMRTSAGDIALERDRVLAVGLRDSLREARPRDSRDEAVPAAESGGVWLGWRDGSCWRARTIRQEGANLVVTLANGESLRADRELFREELRFVQPLSKPLLYLSDLEPLGFRHVPWIAGEWGWGRDRNVTGGILRAGERAYRKGLGMHSSSRLAYQLSRGYRELQAELAVDASAGRGGSVVFRAYVDRGDGEWELAFSSEVVRGGERPTTMRVNVVDAERVALIIDFADRGDELDRANWLDARLIAK